MAISRIVEHLFKIIFCHLVGDYVLQIDFIAKTKGSNWYHLLVHCFLYILPFYLCFGFDKRLIVLLLTHISIDAEKARWHMISYLEDQWLHYIVSISLYWLDLFK